MYYSTNKYFNIFSSLPVRLLALNYYTYLWVLNCDTERITSSVALSQQLAFNFSAEFDEDFDIFYVYEYQIERLSFAEMSYILDPAQFHFPFL